MNELDNFFNVSENTDDPKISVLDFITETRKILKRIEEGYSQSVIKRRVTDEEYSNSDCDNCIGTCVIKSNDKEYECFPDKMEGDCFINDFDHELFSELVENVMFLDKDTKYFEMLYGNIIPEPDQSRRELPTEEEIKRQAFEFKVDYKPFEEDCSPQDYAEYGFTKGANYVKSKIGNK